MSVKVPHTDPFGPNPVDSRNTPLEYLRSVFTAFYQGLFSYMPPGMYHWSENDEQSEIFISMEGPVKASTVGARPCISFTRAPLNFYSLGLDDMMEYDQRTGQKTKSVLVPGTFIINCSSRVPLECERIAWVCAEQLWLHRELLMRAGFFEIGRSPAISAVSPAGSIIQNDGGDEWYTTSVTCPFQFYRTSAMTPLNAPILSHINMLLRLRLRTINEQFIHLDGHGGPLNNGAGVPIGVVAYPPPPLAPLASDVYGRTPTAGEPPIRLPVQPHPLNPAVSVVVRGVRPNSPALKPPSIGGRAIPIAPARVEESFPSQTDDPGEPRKVKV